MDPSKIKSQVLRSAILATFLGGVGCLGISHTQTIASRTYAPAKLVATLSDKRVDESSGMAASPTHPNMFWTHNDSGDGPVLYAFDRQGRPKGSLTLEGVKARDWEDMAACTLDGQAYLLAADVGDNLLKHSQYQLHLVREPKNVLPNQPLRASPEMTLRFRYESGQHNCESVAIDPTTRTIFLLTKPQRLGTPAQIFALTIPQKAPTQTLVARLIGQLKIPAPTGMDISQDGLRAVVIGYGPPILLWERLSVQEPWASVFKRAGQPIAEAPFRIQGESVCFGHDGQSLFLGSEKLPTPLWHFAPKP